MLVMNDFLPSRRVTAFVLVPVVTIFLLWAVNSYYSSPTVKEQERSALALSLEAGNRDFQDLDTDGDGLKDWEEFLFQTDQDNTDTDGDGVSDGVEVQRGFDPLVPGNGETEEEVAPENESGFTFYKNDPSLTRTDVLARDIFIAYADLKKGDALDLASIRDRAIEKSIEDNTGVESELVFTDEDIRIVPISTANKSAYTRGYEQATRQLGEIQFTELELFARYIDAEDESALVELAKNKRLYESFAQELAEVSVPESISDVHLELINNLMIYADSIGSVLLISEDPLGGLVYIQKSIEDEQLLAQNLDALSLYFTGNAL